MSNMHILEELKEAEERVGFTSKILGKGSMQPFRCNNSATRVIMLSTQLEHMIGVNQPEPALLQTGFEGRFGEHSSSFIVANCPYKVLAKIYKHTDTKNDNKHCHYYLIIEAPDGSIDVIERKSYEYITETYGFMYDNFALDKLSQGATIKPGQNLKKTKAFDDYCNRQDGLNLLTTYVSCEYTKEDAILVSKSASSKMSAPLIKKIKIMMNDNDIPLNIYGDENNYLSFPKLGTEVKDGIICSLRREKKEEALFSQCKDRLSKLMISDEKFSAHGTLVDINIRCNNPDALMGSMYSEQLAGYYQDNMRFLEELVTVVEGLEKQGRKLSYNLQVLYEDGKRILEGGQYINDKVYSYIDLELYVIQDMPLGIGDKISNRYGGKGVVSQIIDDELMPLLDNGERVEVIFNSSTCVNRENPGQLYETTLNFIGSRIIEYIDNNTYDYASMMEIYLRYLDYVVPDQARELRKYFDREDVGLDEQEEYLQELVKGNGVILSMPPLSNTVDIDVIDRIYKDFSFIKPYTVMVPIKDSMGNIRMVKTRRSLIAGRQYIYRLKQYAEEKFSAVSLSVTNIKNENARNNSKKANKALHSKTCIRFGEMETGNMLHLGAETVITNLMLTSLSPKGRRLAEKLLVGDPYEVDVKLDNDSTNRSVEILNAYLKTMGIELSFNKVYRYLNQPVMYNPFVYYNRGTGLAEPIKANDNLNKQDLSYNKEIYNKDYTVDKEGNTIGIWYNPVRYNSNPLEMEE